MSETKESDKLKKAIRWYADKNGDSRSVEQIVVAIHEEIELDEHEAHIAYSRLP